MGQVLRYKDIIDKEVGKLSRTSKMVSLKSNIYEAVDMWADFVLKC